MLQKFSLIKSANFQSIKIQQQCGKQTGRNNMEAQLTLFTKLQRRNLRKSNRYKPKFQWASDTLILHLMKFLAPLAIGQWTYVMARYPSCVLPSALMRPWG